MERLSLPRTLLSPFSVESLGPSALSQTRPNSRDGLKTVRIFARLSELKNWFLSIWVVASSFMQRSPLRRRHGGTSALVSECLRAPNPQPVLFLRACICDVSFTSTDTYIYRFMLHNCHNFRYSTKHYCNSSTRSLSGASLNLVARATCNQHCVHAP